jgi:hypothetical protein
MSAGASEEEVEFLKRLRFSRRRPTPLYYYRELQNLRDPLNFRETSVAPLHKYGDSNAVERQMQTHARRGAIQRWAKNKGGKPGKKRKAKTAR